MTAPSEKDVEQADMTEVIGLHDRSCAWVNDFSGKTQCNCPRSHRQKAFATSLARVRANEQATCAKDLGGDAKVRLETDVWSAFNGAMFRQGETVKHSKALEELWVVVRSFIREAT